MNPPTPDSTETEPKWWHSAWLKIGCLCVLLIIAFYLQANWIGQATWNQAQAEVAAAGESLDPKKLIPPPIPDDQNFAALPIFQLQPDPAYPGNMIPQALRSTLEPVNSRLSISYDDSKPQDQLPYLGNRNKGEMPDHPAIEKRLTELCHRLQPAKQIAPGTKPAEMFGLLCPILADLRAANATHPDCRFDVDYASQPPMLRSLGGITEQIKLARLLAYQERLALWHDQSQLALDDLKVDWKIDSGLRQEPMVVSGLVAMGVVAIQLDVVQEGFEHHSWNDAQLVDLDTDLSKIDFLADGQLCSRGEAVIQFIPTVDYTKTHRSFLAEAIYGFHATGGDLQQMVANMLFALIPNGWFEQSKSIGARFELIGMVHMVDPVSRRVFPEKEKPTSDIIDNLPNSSSWRRFLSIMLSPMLKSIANFAHAQTQVDQARIACHLERYHLVHGVYPASLDELVPTYIPALPHDIMNGEAYHYKLNPDGTYLLYSVGWNQIDDKGDGASPPNSSTRDAPDWVWPSHPEKSPAK